MTTDLLVERLHQALVEEIRARRPEYLRAPFTVAEIYQDLVPYRTHRDRIGAAMNGDYEDALLRLLAGRGGYLVIDSEPARKRLEEELESSNPNTGLFREFAAVDVRLNPSRLPGETSTPVPWATTATGSESPDAPRRPRARSAARSADPDLPISEGASASAELELAVAIPSPMEPAQGADDAEPDEEEPELVERVRDERAVGSSAAAETCRWCREDLPRRENLRYCPFCGMDVNLVPCPSCSEELEPGWRFCIVCGTQVAPE